MPWVVLPFLCRCAARSYPAAGRVASWESAHFGRSHLGGRDQTGAAKLSQPLSFPQPLAVGSWSWARPYYAGRWSLLDLPATACKAGLTFVEANDFMLPPPRFSRLRRPLLGALPGMPPDLWRYSRRNLDALRQRADERGVTVLTWAVNSDFTGHWPGQFLYLRLGVYAARRLGARLLRVNLGGTVDTPAERDEVVTQRLLGFCSRAEGWTPGLAITVENHWGVSSDIDRHLRLVDAVSRRLPGRARFGCCFDPGNVPAGPKRGRWWRALAARANHYHFKTNDDADGGLPHDRLLALLDRAGYRGAATIEYQGQGESLAGVRRSVALFRRLTSGE